MNTLLQNHNMTIKANVFICYQEFGKIYTHLLMNLFSPTRTPSFLSSILSQPRLHGRTLEGKRGRRTEKENVSVSYFNIKELTLGYLGQRKKKKRGREQQAIKTNIICISHIPH